MKNEKCTHDSKFELKNRKLSFVENEYYYKTYA